MGQVLINQFLAELDRLKKVSGTNRETVVREAFKDLIKKWAAQHDLVFVPEYEIKTPSGDRRYVDGALVHSLRIPFGYWEAKDEKDDLDAEIQLKKERGYPQDNIIFEDSRRAVLIQNKKEVLRIDYTDTIQIETLLLKFFEYERPEVAQYNRAIEQFKIDLPHVLIALREQIEQASKTNKTFSKEEKKFLTHARDTINPSIDSSDIREMLIQHILTEDIFSHIFNESDFHRENNIAKELYSLETTFFKGATKKQTLKQIEPYYAAIRTAASQIPTHGEKQTFLKAIYENFYKVYNPKAADRLGVIYTPNEVVRFMINSSDWLCEKHFNKSLIDKNVEILDPATGTGTFVCALLEHFRGQESKLKYKFKEEIHANEVAILPYYVANLNIEATYASITNSYEEYQNLCFVDTLDMVEGLGKFSGTQESLFGAMSDENIERIKRQNKKKISIIIGNPPYNANQKSENENNKNREYARIDARIKNTYVAQSNAQKTKMYDMYARFFRWASDRIRDDGIIAFITNRGFLDKKSYDGFRKIITNEFDEIRIVDLGGDWKTPGDGGGGNVFNIGTGVAISFLIKSKSRAERGKAKIYYATTGYIDAEDKLTWLNNTNMFEIKFETIRPDTDGNWLNKPEHEFSNSLTIASKAVKEYTTGAGDRAVFRYFTLGHSTNRDEWVYDYDTKNLLSKIKRLISEYEKQRKKSDGGYKGTIKWSSSLKIRMAGNKTEPFSDDRIIDVLYRPFCKKKMYDTNLFIDRNGGRELLFPRAKKNKVICFTDPTSQKPWLVFASQLPLDLHFVGSGAGTVCLSLYKYNSDGERIDNITNWTLEQFSERYKAASKEITKLDIFHYVYAVLSDPGYQEKFSANLKREFPRIPLHDDFWRWSLLGRELMDLHLNYEQAKKWSINRDEKTNNTTRKTAQSLKPILRSDIKNRLITIDSATKLINLPQQAWTFRLGSRSGIDWVLDQYKEKKITDQTLRDNYNNYKFEDYKEEVIELLQRVITVSVDSMKIIDEIRRMGAFDLRNSETETSN